MPLTRYKLTIAYDGTLYSGFQRQVEPIPTVQAALERAASEILCVPTVVHGSSRTDAGVHARGQVAQLDADTAIEPGRLRKAINSKLPDDILITGLEIAPPGFEASNATHKRYRYLIWQSPDRPLFGRQYVYHYYHRVDLERMREACRHFVGTHDFLAFQSGENVRETTVRTIYQCDIKWKRPRQGAGGTEGAGLMIFTVTGSGFLYHMVRNMVGTVLEAGRVRTDPVRKPQYEIRPEDVPAIMRGGDRGRAGPCAPAQGLCLQWISYSPVR